MRRHFTALAAASLAVLGLAAGLFAFPAAATGPVTINDLSALGYSLGLQGNLDGCSYIVVLSAPGVVFADGHEPVLERNPDPNHFDVCPPTDPVIVQARIDALLAAYPPVPPPTTTTAPVTVTTAITTTSPPITTTVTTPAPPAVTVTDSSTTTVNAPAAAPAMQKGTWAQRADPVLTATQAWEGSAVFEPSVLYDAKQRLYRMWYSGGTSNCSVGYATSRDGIHWGKYSRNPVLGMGRGGVQVACRNNVVQSHGTYYLFFSDGVGLDNDQLRVATSKDGKHWSTRTAPALTYPLWVTRGVANSFEWQDHGQWRMFFEGRAGYDWKMGLATGASLSNWQETPGGPLETVGFGGSYGGAWVVAENGGWRVYFHASTIPWLALPTDIYSRWTADFQTWSEPTLELARSADWQFDQVADPSLANGMMFFDGDDNRDPSHVVAAIGVATR